MSHTLHCATATCAIRSQANAGPFGSDRCEWATTCEHDEGCRAAFAAQAHVVVHERRGVQLRRGGVAQRGRVEGGRGLVCATKKPCQGSSAGEDWDFTGETEDVLALQTGT